VIESPRGIWLDKTTRGANRDLWDLPSVELKAGEDSTTDGRIHPRARGRLKALLRRRRLEVAEITPRQTIRHAIMKHRYRVTVFHGHLRRVRGTGAARQALPGRWVSKSALDEFALTARARKALEFGLGESDLRHSTGSGSRTVGAQ
jgi:hypothetical protein